MLVGFAEAFAAVETAWSLQRAGFRVVLLHRAGSRSSSRFLWGVERVEVPAPETDIGATVSAIQAYVASARPAAFVPLDDGALLVSTLVTWGDTTMVGPGAAGARFALDKAAQVDLAAEVGLPVPPSKAYDSVGGVESITAPSIIKPVDAVRVQDGRLERPNGRVVSDAAELSAAEEAMQPGRVLVQPLVTGVGEGIFGYCDEAGVQQWSAHRRVRMVNPQGSASSACESIEPDRALQPMITEFLAHVGWRGLFMVELLRGTDGVPWFMELNGRAWGSLALARRRGLEYPAWAVEAALGRPQMPAPPAHPPYVRARHLGREALHLAFVVRGPQSAAFAERWPRPLVTSKRLLTFRRGDRLYNWNLRQPWVLVVDTLETLAAQWRGRRSR